MNRAASRWQAFDTDGHARVITVSCVRRIVADTPPEICPMTAIRNITRHASPRLVGGMLLWGVMEAAALRRTRRQRAHLALTSQQRG